MIDARKCISKPLSPDTLKSTGIARISKPTAWGGVSLIIGASKDSSIGTANSCMYSQDCALMEWKLCECARRNYSKAVKFVIIPSATALLRCVALRTGAQ